MIMDWLIIRLPTVKVPGMCTIAQCQQTLPTCNLTLSLLEALP